MGTDRKATAICIALAECAALAGFWASGAPPADARPVQTAQLLPLDTNDKPASSDVIRPGFAPANPPRERQTDCVPAKITGAPLPGGRIKIAVDAPCHGNETVAIGYGSFVFLSELDAAGQAVIPFDLFQGKQELLSVMLQDGRGQVLAPTTEDITHLSKIAIIWRPPVRIDLHAFEYAALAGEPGHVWKQSPGSAEAAMAQVAKTSRGSGYLSHASSAATKGLRLDVYTFVHTDDQARGGVSFAIDYESRGSLPAGDWCGEGQFATVPIDIVVLERGGEPARDSALIAPAKCGEPLTAAVRYQRGVIPSLRAGR